MNEFTLIRRFFAPLAGKEGLGLKDDAALCRVPVGKELVVTTDAMSAGVHFFENDPAQVIAQKLLRVNLSDLAAMGATPTGYTLSLILPRDTSEEWLAEFSAGLKADQEQFGIKLFGGDTVVHNGPLVLSITAFGTVKKGTALRRSKARPGDRIYVSGTLGDAALGLAILEGKLTNVAKQAAQHLVQRYHQPEPRLILGKALVGHASACMDISDGLVQDMGHICEASGVGASLQQAHFPLTEAARAVIHTHPDMALLPCYGGDDYELLFTLPPAEEKNIARLAKKVGVSLTPIGTITKAPHVVVLDARGKTVQLPRGGYEHG